MNTQLASDLSDRPTRLNNDVDRSLLEILVEPSTAGPLNEHLPAHVLRFASMESALADAIHEAVRLRNPNAIPGIAIGAGVGADRLVVADGTTNVDYPVAVDHRTVFPFASVTKPFVAAATLALQRDGKLRVGDTFEQFLPELAGLSPSATIADLLTHRGGWEGDWALFNAPDSRDPGAIRALVQEMGQVPRVGPPGEVFSYDNFGWCLLGAVVETVAGSTFSDAVQSLVLEPLELHDTFFGPRRAVTRPVAAGHEYDPETDRASIPTTYEPWGDQWPSRRALRPCGGLVGTVDDLLGWADAQHDDRSDSPLGAVLREMAIPRAPAGGQGVEIGFGWFLETKDSPRILHHEGVVDRCTTSVFAIPERRASLVILANSTEADDVTADLLDALMDAVDVSWPTPEPPQVPIPVCPGTYTAVDRTIVVAEPAGDSVAMTITDTGPTWNQENTYSTHSAGPGELVASDDASVTAQFGRLSSGRPWIRYRGRVHPEVEPG